MVSLCRNTVALLLLIEIKSERAAAPYRIHTVSHRSLQEVQTNVGVSPLRMKRLSSASVFTSDLFLNKKTQILILKIHDSYQL